MKLYIGTFRGHKHLPCALESIDKFVKGVDSLVFIDDSGQEYVADWLCGYGEVHSYDRRGYAHTMAVACDLMKNDGDDFVGWWEEDFVATAPICLEDMATVLSGRNDLAQLALLRQPWYLAELQAGGIPQFLQATWDSGSSLWLQNKIFTANPSVWAAVAYEGGWPLGADSEHKKTQELVAKGLWFAYLEGQRIFHIGERDTERLGHGY